MTVPPVPLSELVPDRIEPRCQCEVPAVVPLLLPMEVGDNPDTYWRRLEWECLRCGREVDK